MSTAEMMERIAGGLPRHRAKLVGAYYVLTILTGAFILFFHGRVAFAADLVVAVFYIAATALFYDLSKPVKEGKGADRVAPRNRRERSPMDGAGQRSLSARF
jgi:hypothetical protein